MKADKEDEEMVSARQKKAQKKMSAKEFIEQETQENNIEEENTEKKDKIEIFPYRTSKFNATRKHMNLLMLYR